MADTQAEQEAWQGRLLRLLQRLQDVLSRLLGHAIQAGQRRQAQAVQVGQGVDDAGVHQLVDQLVAEPFHLHRATLGEMQNGLLALRAAKQAARAAGVCLTRFAHRRAATNRTAVGHREHLRTNRTLVCQHPHHLGDHIAGPAHDHRVAHPHVLAPGLVFVVQRRIRHGDAADKNRRQLGHRRQLAGAPHLHVDIEHRGQLLLRRVLVRNGPTRLAGHKTHLALQSQAVHFVDHPIDVEWQAVAQRPDALVIRYQSSSALRPFDAGYNRKTP